jgi:predicted nucleic acid-binding protein
VRNAITTDDRRRRQRHRKRSIPEVGAAPAKALLTAADELIAPGLARAEVAPALIRKGIRQELTGAAVENMLSAWFRALADGQIFISPHADDVEAAAKLAPELRHPLPDCLCLAAAERLGVALITADRGLRPSAARRSDLVQIPEDASN